MTTLDPDGPSKVPLDSPRRAAHTTSRITSRILFSMPNPWAALVNLLIVGLWFWLFRPIYEHLSIIFTREDFRTNQLILVGILALLVMRLRQDGLRLRIDAPLQRHLPALILMAVGALGFLAVERWLNIHILAACLFGLGSYGLLGLWMSPTRWREGLPAALLLVGALPFGDFIEVFIGYPMRIITAEIVRHGLAAAGATSMGVDTILVFENSVAQVDLPCSGVKSLWTGSLFLIAATWIERRPINLRWLLVASAFGMLLFIANLARIGILVWIGQAMGLTLMAELVHVPLGVLGFVGACAAALLLLKFNTAPAATAARPAPILASAPKSPTQPRLQPVFSGALVVMLAGCNLAYTARPTLAPALAPATFASAHMTLPQTLATQPITLRPGELDWLIDDGAEAVERLRFSWPVTGLGTRPATQPDANPLTGSMLLVQSTSWRAHHKPERCFENYGLRIENSQVHLFDAMPVRLMALTNGQAGGRLTALYWFQSQDRVTDDYGSRLWSAMSLQPERWMLVTILFDQAYDPSQPQDAEAMRTLTSAMRDAVHAQLTNHP